ncbi:BglG family transcription antiterminator [Enemella sp. A6]|uniref:BglG family transcription antiterminator n=1 Tax=Enemella sp. A6 TaxID=3440152 RepID=UPI003EBD8554
MKSYPGEVFVMAALSERSNAILSDMLQSSVPIHVRQIAEQYAISDRMAKYDIQAIRRWLGRHGTTMISVPGQGHAIEVDDSTRADLLQKLASAQVFPSHEARVYLCAVQLLLSTGPMTKAELQEFFGVSRSTLTNDLRAVQTLLTPFGITVEPGRTGLIADTDIRTRRASLDRIVRSRMTNDDLAWCSAAVAGRKKLDPSVLSPELRHVLEAGPYIEVTLEAVHRITHRIMADFNVQLSDSAIAGLVLRLAICRLLGDEERSAQPPNVAAAPLRSAFLDELSGLDLTTDEFDFFFVEAAIAVSAKLMPLDVSDADDVEVAPLARRIAERVGTELGVNLLNYHALLPGLIAHLSDRITKYKYDILEPNSLLDELKLKYQPVYEAVKIACDDYLLPLGVSFSEPDLAFLVVHFATAFEHCADVGPVRALVVCATGRGNSRLITMLISTAVPEIDVVGTCSTFDAPRRSQDPEVELVITTFPLNLCKPTAVIKPVPTERDYDILREHVKDLGVAAAPGARRETHAVNSTDFIALVSAGIEFANRIAHHHREPLSPELAEGLRLHCILLAERVASNTQFDTDLDAAHDTAAIDAAEHDQGWALTTAEKQAAATYLNQEAS